MTKHTSYYELRDALAEPGCPICRLVVKAVERLAASLIYDRANDPGAQADVRRARGYCNLHAWQLADQTGAAFDVAILYRTALRALLELVGGAETPLNGPLGAFEWLRSALNIGEAVPNLALAEALGPQAACPACAMRAQTERAYISTLLAHLDDAEISGALVQGGGLCWPHFRLSLVAPAESAQLPKLVAFQRLATEHLLAEVEAFIRKHDYRFADEPTLTEGDAWLRAVAQVSGSRGVW